MDGLKKTFGKASQAISEKVRTIIKWNFIDSKILKRHFLDLISRLIGLYAQYYRFCTHDFAHSDYATLIIYHYLRSTFMQFNTIDSQYSFICYQQSNIVLV